MNATLKNSALFVFAFSWFVAAPVFAQQTNTAPVPYPHAGDPAYNTPNEREFGEECAERQEYREELQRIRGEFEELDAEHDRLKAQCMDAKGQERSTCQIQKEDLHTRMNALHVRRQALHDRMAKDPRNCHVHHGGPLHHPSKPPAATAP